MLDVVQLFLHNYTKKRAAEKALRSLSPVPTLAVSSQFLINILEKFSISSQSYGSISLLADFIRLSLTFKSCAIIAITYSCIDLNLAKVRHEQKRIAFQI